MASYTITSIKTGKQTEVQFEYLSKLTDELDELSTAHKELSEFDIYKITLWKINRYPQIDPATLKELNELRKLSEFDKERTKNILYSMLHIHGIGLAMASTYLRFTNPKIYPIIDTRALRAAFDYERTNDKEKTISDHRKSESLYEQQIDLYIKYVNKLMEFSKTDYHGLKIDFENLDRFLYDIDDDAKFALGDKEPFNEENITNWKNIIRKYGGKIE